VVDEEPLPFSHHLRRLREAAGLTQEELAERAGISVKAVSALERGRRQRPYPHTVRALGDALGLTDAERALLAGSMPERTRPARQGDVPLPSLPNAPTALIGRQQELADVTRLLTAGRARLVTLTGPGGVGKTRLAQEVAQQLSEPLQGRVRFVSLAPLRDPALVLPTVAQAVGVIQAGTSSARELLAAFLDDDHWVLVLDNAEHLLAFAPDLADVLAMCPTLAVLVTSRAPLKIRAEHEYPVRPLPVPDLSHVPTLADVERVSSVQLFVERAQAAAPSFALTQANCAAVAAVCRRLDGLPLALELVAARLRVLSPTEVLARLDRLLPLLVGGPRDLPQRQQTMSAAIDWSYELLGAAEQTLFRRLSVFAGGWTLAAAESVTAWGQLGDGEIVDLLGHLVEQSLIVAEARPDGVSRYRMLEPIRQFATTCVEASGEQDTLRNRHLAWCLALAREAAQELRGSAQQAWLNRLEQEHDNMRVALGWSAQDGTRIGQGLQLAVDIWRFWSTRGYLAEGQRWLETALAASADVPEGLRAEGYNAAGNLARDQGEHAQAQRLHETSLELRRRIGDRRGVAVSLNNLGTVALDQGQYARATHLYDEALTLFRAVAQDWEIAIALHNLGLVMGRRGEFARATGLIEEALVIWERVGDATQRARSLDALGEVSRRQGDLERAAALHERSLALRQQLGETRGIALALRNLALVAHDRGDYERAARLLEEALDLYQRVGDKRGTALTLAARAGVAQREGDVVRALQLYREAIAMHAQLQVREELPACLVGVAALIRTRAPEHAARLLGASAGIREAMGQAVPAAERAGIADLTSALQDVLRAEVFQHYWTAGRELPLPQALQEALDDG
jgi:predicted ATPase/Tfp pilus assembly protein PilF/DNA-binding XRE family transcriptional regulator